MYHFCIHVLFLGLLAIQPINGQSELEVQLIVPRYVERGSSATMQCRHNVRPEILFKVTWLKVDKGKFFEYINGRNPPFRNSSISGGEIDWENSNETQVTLKNVDFDLSGQFYCEVSTDTPIYTKASGDALLTTYLPQTGPPIIKFRKRAPFAIGERLFALCNTTKARPAPHVTWLINGKKIEEKYVRTHHVYSYSGKNHRRSQQQQHVAQNLEQTQQPYHQPNFNQYPQQYLQHHYTDRWDKSLRSGRTDEFGTHSSYHHDGSHHHAASSHNNPFSPLVHEIYGIHEIQHRNYDQSQLLDIEMKKKKHRNSANRKYRRHINENALGIIRSTLNSGGFGPQAPKLNNELGIPANAGPMSQLAAGYGRPISHPGGGVGVAAAAAAVTAATEKAEKDKGMFSISQLSLELTEQHVGTNGRMEITCLSTIPATVGQGEQFADYKTYSVKVEVDRAEVPSSTSTAPPNMSAAALGNGSVDSGGAATGRTASAVDGAAWCRLLCALLLTLATLLKISPY